MFSVDRSKLVGYDILNDESDEIFLEIYIVEKEPEYELMKNMFKHSKLFNYRIYELYSDSNKFTYYAMQFDDMKTHFDNFIKQTNIVSAYYDSNEISCVIIDDTFFKQLYDLKNSGSKATIIQLCLFPDDENILKKCKSKIGFYMVAKISIMLANKCIISPEHNITAYRIDNVFTISSFNEYVPKICLEIDENNHNDRDKGDETCREEFIKTFGYKIIRVPVKRNADDSEINRLINKTCKDIELLIEDLIIEYSLNISESDFVNKVENELTIDKEFAMMFARKNNSEFDHFKYTHVEVAKFLGYENVENYKHFITMMKRELKSNIDYIIPNHDANISTVNRRNDHTSKPIKTKTIYYISRIGFYILCMMANKPNAKLYRRQFGELYEFSINYVNSLRKKVINNIQPSDISENAVTTRLNNKVESVVKNKSISKLEEHNIKLKSENEKLLATIKSLTEEKNKFKLEAKFYMEKCKNTYHKSNNRLYDIQLKKSINEILKLEIMLKNSLSTFYGLI
jgi:hypothetical protein